MDCCMAREKIGLQIDDRVIEALKKLAQQSNASTNRYIESVLFAHAKQAGALPINAEPLGESRGGDRKSAKAKEPGHKPKKIEAEVDL
jgi:hypothetical protein